MFFIFIAELILNKTCPLITNNNHNYFTKYTYLDTLNYLLYYLYIQKIIICYRQNIDGYLTYTKK